VFVEALLDRTQAGLPLIRAKRNPTPFAAFSSRYVNHPRRRIMGRGLLLWLIGIPLPIILIIWLFGGLS
jgi:hypothetical protein